MKEEELITKVQRDENDRTSTEVKGKFLFLKAWESLCSNRSGISDNDSIMGNILCCFTVAIMTARIRNFQEHLHKHPKVNTAFVFPAFIKGVRTFAPHLIQKAYGPWTDVLNTEVSVQQGYFSSAF